MYQALFSFLFELLRYIYSYTLWPLNCFPNYPFIFRADTLIYPHCSASGVQQQCHGLQSGTFWQHRDGSLTGARTHSRTDWECVGDEGLLETCSEPIGVGLLLLEEPFRLAQWACPSGGSCWCHCDPVPSCHKLKQARAWVLTSAYCQVWCVIKQILLVCNEATPPPRNTGGAQHG